MDYFMRREGERETCVLCTLLKRPCIRDDAGDINTFKAYRSTCVSQVSSALHVRVPLVNLVPGVLDPRHVN